MAGPEQKQSLEWIRLPKQALNREFVKLDLNKDHKSVEQSGDEMYSKQNYLKWSLNNS